MTLPTPPLREMDIRAVAIVKGWFPATTEERQRIEAYEIQRWRQDALGYPPPPPAPERPLAPDVIRK